MVAYVVYEQTEDLHAGPEFNEPHTHAFLQVLTQYGGKLLVNGAFDHVLEGAWHPMGLVVLEFATMEQLDTWYNSPENTRLKDLRLANRSRGQAVAIHGVARSGG